MKSTEKEKIRTIITQDAEVDDQNSLRHFLLYANEVELQGIVQTSSTFHWKGVPGAITPPKKQDTFSPVADLETEQPPYDKPHRWTGTEWMFQVIDDYAQVYPNLKAIDSAYPDPKALRRMTKVGNVGYPGEMLAPTEGSEWIKEAILDQDPRKLYLQVWGGCNTIARALLDIQKEYEGSSHWEELYQLIRDKVVITACGEQDDAYRGYIAEEWPDIQFVLCTQICGYAYSWGLMPESDSKDCLRAAFMKELVTGKGALMDGYALWLDGKTYIGEADSDQFGSNPDLQKTWWGKMIGLAEYQPYDFLSEGDSPTYFMMLDWGLRTLEDFSYGGFSGRYVKDETQKNSKGQPLNLWQPQNDLFTDRGGQTAPNEASWRYIAEIQRDFAARTGWCVTAPGQPVECAPMLMVLEGLDREVCPGETVRISCKACGRGLYPAADVNARIYEEASTLTGAMLSQKRGNMPDIPVFEAAIPKTAKAGQVLHVIVQAKNQGGYGLTHYQQVILTVK